MRDKLRTKKRVVGSAGVWRAMSDESGGERKIREESKPKFLCLREREEEKRR